MKRIEDKHIIYTFVAPNMLYGTNLDIPGFNGGHWNGYIVIHKDNPLYGLDIDAIELPHRLQLPHIHGGWTYSKVASSCSIIDGNIPDVYKSKDYWVYGFDTLHHGDTLLQWPKEKVKEEIDLVVPLFYGVHFKKIKDDNRTECGRIVSEGDGEGG